MSWVRKRASCFVLYYTDHTRWHISTSHHKLSMSHSSRCNLLSRSYWYSAFNKWLTGLNKLLTSQQQSYIRRRWQKFNSHVTCRPQCVSSAAERQLAAGKTLQRQDKCVEGHQVATYAHGQASTCRILHSTASPSETQTVAKCQLILTLNNIQLTAVPIVEWGGPSVTIHLMLMLCLSKSSPVCNEN